MPGCIGSLDCSPWEWRNCPKAFSGMYQNRRGKRYVVMETVCDEDRWIWHLFVGCPGSHNDFNVMHVSPLYLSITNGEWPPRTFSFTANDTTRTLLYSTNSCCRLQEPLEGIVGSWEAFFLVANGGHRRGVLSRTCRSGSLQNVLKGDALSREASAT